MKKDAGFTFIELLISVTIAAVLMATAVVSYSNTSKRSRDAKRQADMQVIRSALEICRSNDGVYPVGIYDNVSCIGTTTLQNTPKDPKTAANYTYSRPTTTTYGLGCTLELTGSCSY